MEENTTTQENTFKEFNLAENEEQEQVAEEAIAESDGTTSKELEQPVCEDTAEDAPKGEEEPEKPAVDPDLALTRKVNGLSNLLRTYYAQNAKGGAHGNPLRGQGRVLAFLAMRPEATQKEIQLILDMKQQSLSELLTKLESKGYITRERSGKDGRMVIVRLTEAGAAAAPDLSEKSEVPSPFDCLDEDARERFEHDIDAITAALKERVGQDAKHDHGDEEGEQKRHRYGQQGRMGGQGKGHGKGGHGKASGSLASAAASSIPLGDLAMQVLGAATGTSGRGMGGGRGRGMGGGRH